MLRLTLALAISLTVPSAGALPATTPQIGGVEATVQAAESLLAQGDATAALRTAERLVAADPFDVEAHHLIQRILRSRDRAAMLTRYRELARRHPGNPAAQYLLGNALLNAEDLTAARLYFDRALQIDPGFGWAASIEAIFAQVSGDPDEALRLARMSVQNLSNDLTTAATYAELLRLNGLRDEAVRFLDQAAALNPDDPRFLLELWRLRMRGVDDYQAERAAFSWQVAAHRDRFLLSAELTAELAEFYRGAAMGDPEGARQLWLTLADRFPTNPEAKNALLRAADMTDDADTRMELYERIVSDYPDSPIRYRVYYDMLRHLIAREDFDRALRTARSLTSAPDPGRPGDDYTPGQFEKPTPWGYTLQGIGYAGWFAAAQADADAGARAVYSTYYVGEREQPISPDALAAARALEASSCNDPRTLRYVGQFLLESSYHRPLGIRLIERAARSAAGADPLTDLAYGTDELEAARRDLERTLRNMPIYYALAGMMPQAEQAVARLLAELPPPGVEDRARRRWQAHWVAARVYDLAGRWRDAARHYVIAEWESPSLPRRMPDGFLDDLARIYAEIGPPDIRRHEPGRGPRLQPMSFALEPVEGAASLDAAALGGDLLLIVFWSTWNESSIAQVLALDALALELEDPRLSTLAVAVQEPARIGRDGLDRFARFRRDTALTIPMARGTRDTIDRIDLLGLPTTLLLDASGRVLARQLGFNVPREDWSQAWRAVLREELARLEAQ